MNEKDKQYERMDNKQESQSMTEIELEFKIKEDELRK